MWRSTDFFPVFTFRWPDFSFRILVVLWTVRVTDRAILYYYFKRYMCISSLSPSALSFSQSLPFSLLDDTRILGLMANIAIARTVSPSPPPSTGVYVDIRIAPSTPVSDILAVLGRLSRRQPGCGLPALKVRLFVVSCSLYASSSVTHSSKTALIASKVGG